MEAESCNVVRSKIIESLHYRMPAATQTDARLLSFDEEARPTTKDIASEANVLPAVKQVRHRASNTENRSMVDQETNTRPRGINVSITFGGDEQVWVIRVFLIARLFK